MGWIRSSSWVFTALVVLALGACGTSSDGSSGGDGGNGTITVRGTVISGMLAPIPSVPVVIEGHPLVVTDGYGQFEVSGVTPPYTAIVMEMDTNTATVYQGLTRSDPYVLRRYTTDGLTSGPRWGKPTGTVFGGVGWPTPAGIRTGLDMSPAYADWSTGESVNPLTGDYDPFFMPDWAGPMACPVTIHAFQYEYDGTTAVSFTGYGRRFLYLFDGETAWNQDIYLEPVPTYEHSGSVTAPPGVTISGKHVYVNPTPGESLYVAGVSDALSSFTLHSPGVPGATVSVACLGGSADGSVFVARPGLTGDTPGLQFALPAPPQALQPADGATGVGYDTLFTYTSLPGTVNEVHIGGDPFVYSGAQYVIVTTATEVRVPDLSAYGLGLQESAAGRWWVAEYGPLNSVDDAAGPDSLWPSGVDERVRATTAGRSCSLQP